MKKLLILVLVSTFYCAGAQTGKFRTLNYFVADSVNAYQFDSFDYVNVTISVHTGKIYILQNKTHERQDYEVVRFEKKEKHTVAHLKNGNTFHYHPAFKRVYFCDKDMGAYTEYKRH